MESWVAIRSLPSEGCNGWWIKARPHAALRGFTHDIAWVNGGEENADKAALIAAAPEMLEALKAMRAFVGNMSFHPQAENDHADTLVEQATAAIAKAEAAQ